MSSLHGHRADSSVRRGTPDRDRTDPAVNSAAHLLLFGHAGKEGTAMSLVRLLGFATLDCGCVVGRYLDRTSNREVSYVEEKGAACSLHLHRRNHTVLPQRASVLTPVFGDVRAS